MGCMYGKLFATMFEGSMYGAGPTVFSVMSYVIAHTQKARVELNPRLLAATIGTTQGEIKAAIDWLCRPDPESRNPAHDGRRLIKEGTYQYFVVSFDHYHAIRNEEERREYNRTKKAEERAKKKSKPLPGENLFAKAAERGDQQAMDRISSPDFIKEQANDRRSEYLEES